MRKEEENWGKFDVPEVGEIYEDMLSEQGKFECIGIDPFTMKNLTNGIISSGYSDR